MLGFPCPECNQLHARREAQEQHYMSVHSPGYFRNDNQQAVAGLQTKVTTLQRVVDDQQGVLDSQWLEIQRLVQLVEAKDQEIAELKAGNDV